MLAVNISYRNGFHMCVCVSVCGCFLRVWVWVYVFTFICVRPGVIMSVVKELRIGLGKLLFKYIFCLRSHNSHNSNS